MPCVRGIVLSFRANREKKSVVQSFINILAKLSSTRQLIEKWMAGISKIDPNHHHVFSKSSLLLFFSFFKKRIDFLQSGNKPLKCNQFMHISETLEQEDREGWKKERENTLEKTAEISRLSCHCWLTALINSYILSSLTFHMHLLLTPVKSGTSIVKCIK